MNKCEIVMCRNEEVIDAQIEGRSSMSDAESSAYMKGVNYVINTLFDVEYDKKLCGVWVCTFADGEVLYIRTCDILNCVMEIQRNGYNYGECVRYENVEIYELTYEQRALIK